MDYVDCDEDTLTYNETLNFHFDDEASAPLTEDSLVTTFNLPMMVKSPLFKKHVCASVF